jgi:class 3 adenylate cyclase
MDFEPPVIGGIKPEVHCLIGIHSGPTFVAEVGDPRGRREYNVLGDTVNATARLMSSAERNQIVISEPIQQAIAEKYECKSLGEKSLKGKSMPMRLYELEPQKRSTS